MESEEQRPPSRLFDFGTPSPATRAWPERLEFMARGLDGLIVPNLDGRDNLTVSLSKTPADGPFGARRPASPGEWHSFCFESCEPPQLAQWCLTIGLASLDESQGNSMKLAVTMELYSYWNRLRRARGAPERNDVDPGAIRGVLADTFVLEFDDRRGFPFRIAGSRVNALFLKELRGLPFLELWREADRKEMNSVLNRVADEAQPFLIGAEARPAGLGSVEIEAILLPLRHHGLTRSRLLGGFGMSAAPDWTGLVGAGPIALTSLRALDSSLPAGLTHDGAADAGFLVPQAPKRYKHLFVYSSGG
jgi:hypothetical protein